MAEKYRIRDLEERRAKAQAEVDEVREGTVQGRKILSKALNETLKEYVKVRKRISDLLGPEYVAAQHARIAALDGMRSTARETFYQIERQYDQAVRELAAIDGELLAAKQIAIAEKQAAAAEEQTRLAAKQTDLAEAQTGVAKRTESMNRFVAGFIGITLLATGAQVCVSHQQTQIARDALAEARRAADAAERQAMAAVPVPTCTVIAAPVPPIESAIVPALDAVPKP